MLYLTVFNKKDMVSVTRDKLNTKELFGTSTPRLYLYGHKDDMVNWKDVEDHVAEAKTKGYVVEHESFEDTGHVSHLVKHEKEYLDAVQKLWSSV